MAAGEVVLHGTPGDVVAEDVEHGYGAVVTASGRVSVAKEYRRPRRSCRSARCSSPGSTRR